jgi:FXSXX-COOH protein
MSDDLVDIEAIDVQGLSPAQLAELGDSSLGHAVHRRLTNGGKADAPDGGAPIAAFQDSL